MIPTKSREALAALGVVVVMTGCGGAPVGRVSDKWVMAGGAGSGIWIAGAPAHGAALAPKVPVAASECIANDVIKKEFDDCSAHETEGRLADLPTPALVDGEVPLGPSPTPGQVCWYTRDNVTVRIVLSRCGSENTFKVSQIAVAAPRKP